MKTTIYYFSATGNSLQVAKILQEELQGELKPISNNIRTVCSSDVIGLVFPTYFWGIPHIVDTFLKHISIKSENPYVFAVTTCKLTSGGALGMVSNHLQKHNLKLSYGKTIHSVGTYIVEYDVNKRKIEKTLNKVIVHTKKVSKDILLRKSKNISKPLYLHNKFYNIYLKRRKQDHLFSADDRCVSCGTCQTVCPVQNIVINQTKPEFQHHCEHCFACVHWCPTKALQYNNVTDNKNHYTNPHILINELNK